MSVRLQLFENRIKISAFGLPLRSHSAAAFLLCGGVPFARQLALAGFRSAQAPPPPALPFPRGGFPSHSAPSNENGRNILSPVFRGALPRHIFAAPYLWRALFFRFSAQPRRQLFSFNRFRFPFRFRLRRQPHPRQKSEHRPRRSRVFARSPLPLAQNFPRQAQCLCFPRSFCCGSPR